MAMLILPWPGSSPRLLGYKDGLRYAFAKQAAAFFTKQSPFLSPAMHLLKSMIHQPIDAAVRSRRRCRMMLLAITHIDNFRFNALMPMLRCDCHSLRYFELSALYL